MWNDNYNVLTGKKIIHWNNRIKSGAGCYFGGKESEDMEKIKFLWDKQAQ